MGGRSKKYAGDPPRYEGGMGYFWPPGGTDKRVRARIKNKRMEVGSREVGVKEKTKALCLKSHVSREVDIKEREGIKRESD